MTSPGEESDVAWHALSTTDVLGAVKSSEGGLSAVEARVRLDLHGSNRLPQQPPPGVLAIVVRQFKSPLITILAIAATVSFFIHPDDPTDALFIAAVLLLNAAIGTWHEWNAEKSSRALQRLLQIKASVLRDGEILDIEAEEVVPGDIVWLESGNRVAADIRLLFAHGLEVDESLLTGESLAVTKDQAWKRQGEVPMGDRLNMVYAGSMVVRGRARGVVVGTGAATAIGQLARDVLQADGGRPPLLERMERFTRAVAIAVLGAAVLISVAGVLLRGYGVNEMFLFGVALAVSAIPEGLPVALTVALAVAATRMARRGVIVRRLAAVEGLGSCTLICSDKTGTLTCNELTVRVIGLPEGDLAEVAGEGFAPSGKIFLEGRLVLNGEHEGISRLIRAAVLCNEAELHQRDGAWGWHGDPTDVALLSLGYKYGLIRETVLVQYPQLNEIPFEPERQYAATFHQGDREVFACVKGAPERVLAMCRLQRSGKDSGELLAFAAALAGQGYRVLALASGPVAAEMAPSMTPPEPGALSFLGFVGMIDPLRPGAREAVTACQSAGVGISMITGDHPVTALAIARDLGFADRPAQVVTGQELKEMSAAELRQAVDKVRVFARTTPRQKLQLVEAARQSGHYVAVTGDGVNDAPALRQANIGVAMGRSGTDVAREAAELVIVDDNFATIVAGIEEGRIAYDNIRKVIYLLVSTGAAEVVLLGLAIVTGWPDNTAGQAILPLLPVQLLWLNLVTNGIQDVALAFDPGEEGVLRRRPRPPRERIFNRLMVERTVIAAVVIAVIGFVVFCWMIEVAGWMEDEARNGLLLLMVLFENIHILNCRSESKSIFRMSLTNSPILLGGALLAFAAHMAAMHIPFMQRILRIEPVEPLTFFTLLGLALTILATMEIHKRWRGRGQKTS